MSIAVYGPDPQKIVDALEEGGRRGRIPWEQDDDGDFVHRSFRIRCWMGTTVHRDRAVFGMLFLREEEATLSTKDYADLHASFASALLLVADDAFDRLEISAHRTTYDRMPGEDR